MLPDEQTESDAAAQKKLGEEMRELYEKIAELEPRQTPHGSVWLFLREKPAAGEKKAAAADGAR